MLIFEATGHQWRFKATNKKDQWNPFSKHPCSQSWVCVHFLPLKSFIVLIKYWAKDTQLLFGGYNKKSTSVAPKKEKEKKKLKKNAKQWNLENRNTQCLTLNKGYASLITERYFPVDFFLFFFLNKRTNQYVVNLLLHYSSSADKLKWFHIKGKWVSQLFINC